MVYTGTHDNDTTLGWYRALYGHDKDFCRRYLHLDKCDDIESVWELIRAALASVANLTVIPMQDYLMLGAEARINTPSTLGNNWKWRMRRDAFTKELAWRIRDMARMYGRVH